MVINTSARDIPLTLVLNLRSNLAYAQFSHALAYARAAVEI